MLKVCLRCGYERKSTDSAPDYECPSCGRIYAKMEAAHTKPPLTKADSVESSGQKFIAKANKVIVALKEANEKNKAIVAASMATQNNTNASQNTNANKDVDSSVSLSIKGTRHLSVEEIAEAQQYHLKAQFILNELHANIKVYGSNSGFNGGNPANVNLALQYINRSLEICPDNTAYLNLKALLLWEGLGLKQQALEILERAVALNPRDIDIQNNLNTFKNWKPSKLTAIGYIGIGLGLLMMFAAFSVMKEDEVKGFYFAVAGVVFVSFSFNGARK